MSIERGNHGINTGHDNKGFFKDIEHVQINESVENNSVSRSNQNIKPTSEKEAYKSDDDVDISCGIWKLRTNIFGRKFSNLFVFSVFMGLSSFFSLMVQSVLSIHLTSIERQFQIDNTKAGLFDTSARIGSMCTILFAGHFAKKVHIPLVVGVAGVLQGIILMVPAFLQFAHPYKLPVFNDEGVVSNITNMTDYGENGKYLCMVNHHEGNTTNGSLATAHAPAVDQATSQAAFVVIIIVQAVKGITDAFHAGFLPSLYVDDNMVDKTKMGLIFGINSVISELATPIGKQINGILSNVPIDLIPTEMDPKDRRFVAAWWMAFLVFGAGTVLFSFPVMLFPRKLVSRRQQEAALKKAMVTFTAGSMFDEEEGQDGQKNSEKEKSLVVKAAADNSSVLGVRYGKNSLSPRLSQQSGSLDVHGVPRKRSSLIPPVTGPSERRVSIDGSMIFEQPITPKAPSTNEDPIQGSSNLKDLIRDFPKAFVRILRRPVFVLIIIDIVVISITMFGTAIFRSVYITNEYNVSMANVAMLTGITQAVGQILGIIVSGWMANRVRTKMGYNYIIVGTYIVSMFITPLYIIFGCENQTIYGHTGDYGAYVNTTEECGCVRQLLSCGNDGNNYLSPCHAGCNAVHGKTFTNCSGLAELNNTLSVTLTPGECPSNCHTNYLLYVIFHAVQITLQSMATIPRRLLILRLVEPKDRGFATSIFAFASTLMAIPAPNLFGRLFDNTCLIWDGDYCSLYDRDKIRYLLSGMDIAVSIFVQFTMLLIMYFFRKEEKDLKKKLQQEALEKEEATKTNIKL